jgi:hypothetical protein
MVRDVLGVGHYNQLCEKEPGCKGSAFKDGLSAAAFNPARGSMTFDTPDTKVF